MAKNNNIKRINKNYKASYLVGTTLNISSISNTVILLDSTIFDVYSYGRTNSIKVISPSGEIKEIATDENTEGEIVLSELGFYTIQYAGEIRQYLVASGSSTYSDYSFKFIISVVENHLPLKKWTITDVINRTLDLAKPIRKGAISQFRLNAEQAAQFDKILAPQFSFTKQTLRECLQEIGKVIHGEPRLTPKKDGNEWYYEVSYDLYASQERSGIYTLPYIKKTVSQLIDNYTSYLDSNAENLVNQLDKFGGVIVEPYHDGAKTVRTENIYARIEEGNMLIPTQYPIYTVDKLEYVYTDGGVLKSVDITPWLFEKSVYDSQLASYKEQYPYSKAYGLYYAQGSKNIGGLNFKVDAAVLAEFQNYAITNILRRATGSSSGFNSDYPEMAFRVTYTPFYNARVAQTKTNYLDFYRPAALIYNQASNVIESRYYGENLRGAVARLGNVDKSLTYIVYNLKLIPKAGQMYDKDYYISAVAVEMLSTCFLVTIGLSKDFNRLSAYIGVNSEKRYSEISQSQAVERNVLYREYIIISDSYSRPVKNCLIGNNLLAMIADTFTQVGGYKPLSNVCAWGTSYNGNDVGNAINLPVISSAFGNSISFSWKYEDNYSAGAISQPVNNAISSGDTKVKGYFQNSQPYTDYYGRLYYYNFDLQPQGPTVTADNLTDLGASLPAGNKPTQSSGYVSTILPAPFGSTPYIMRKDNREALQVNFQIDFVTNIENFIIGSALASYCPAVRGSGKPNSDYLPIVARLYVFDTELNKFTDHVEAYENVDLSKMQSAIVTVDVQDGYFTVNAGTFPVTESGATKGKSWAIITMQNSVETEVEDEAGNKSVQITYYGGDLLIGQNIKVTAGEAFKPIYFTPRHEIFNTDVWKDRR